jgi:hypothetical protein
MILFEQRRNSSKNRDESLNCRISHFSIMNNIEQAFVCIVLVFIQAANFNNFLEFLEGKNSDVGR